MSMRHATKKGPGRSIGIKRNVGKPGDKLERLIFNGMCTLRNGCGAAGRLALIPNRRDIFDDY